MPAPCAPHSGVGDQGGRHVVHAAIGPHKWLLLAIGWELALFGVLIQFAAVRETFGIRMPTWSDLAMALAVSAFVVAAIEATKGFLRATIERSIARRDRRIIIG